VSQDVETEAFKTNLKLYYLEIPSTFGIQLVLLKLRYTR